MSRHRFIQTKSNDRMKPLHQTPAARGLILFITVGLVAAVAGCHTKPEKQNANFFTSGSREADQRASQRMANQEQLTGSGEGAGEKGAKGAPASAGGESSGGGTNKVPGKTALFVRLGGEEGVTAIVNDFVPRVLQDPRVNWDRNGVKEHGFLSFDQGKSKPVWQATPQNVEILKKHLVQFIALATGGPAHYEGRSMETAHAGMHITNPEFDAAVGDLKASLDRLQIANTEQKELLSIIESTRPEIVTER